MAVLQATLPNVPFADAAGNVAPVWHAFLLSLLARTGGTAGVSSGDTAQAIAAEGTARIAADQTLAGMMTAEQLARSDGLEAEAKAREAADIVLDRRISTASATPTVALRARIWFGQ